MKDFEEYRNQLAEWFQKENSRLEFLEFWTNAVNESESITKRMEVTEDTLIKVIGI